MHTYIYVVAVCFLMGAEFWGGGGLGFTQRVSKELKKPGSPFLK